MSKPRRVIAVLKLSGHVPDLSKQGHAVVQAMTNNPSFPDPVPKLAIVTADLAALDAAEIVAKGKGKGASEARDVKKAIVVGHLQQLLAYVQAIADASPAQAEAIIENAAMSVKKVTPRQKNEASAIQGAVSGVVDLIAAVVAAKACYLWQWTMDQKTWTSLPMTLVSKTSVNGLTPGATHYFRYKAITNGGESDWSQFISLLVK